MNTIVLGGDARMAALAVLLSRTGRDALHVASAEDAAALIPGAGTIVSNCPPRLGTISIEEMLSMASENARIFLCGPGHSEEDPRVTDLWLDEALQLENARLTAEGAVSAAMRVSRRSLRALPCTVIGWGRIGSRLVELLVAMGARVTVATRSEAHRRRAIERGAEAVPPEALTEVLPRTALVFSTPPVMVLDAALLARTNREALVIDLASPPYGVDLRAAWRMGLRAWREPGLPGRHCPESAAEALLHAMERGEVR